MVLGIESSQCGNSVSVVLSPRSSCDHSQSWNMREDGVIVNAQCNSKAIDIASGSRIILWSIHGNDNQIFELDNIDASPTSLPTHAPSPAPSIINSTPSPINPPTVSPSHEDPTSSPLTPSPTDSPIGVSMIQQFLFKDCYNFAHTIIIISVYTAFLH